MNEQLNPENILQTGLAFWASKTLLSAVEMGVFTELADGPESFDSLSGRLGLHSRSARDFLDALVALGFLTRNTDVYANTHETALFLDRKNHHMWAAFTRWPIFASIHSGATSPRGFVPECRKRN